MKVLRFLMKAALILCIGVPFALILFVMGMAAFGVVFGLGMALVGMMLSVLKVALMVIIPVAVLVWLFRLVTRPSRVY